MVSYKVLAIGGSVAEVGLVAAAFGFLSLFFAVPIGRWVDRGSESRFMLIGSALMAVSAAGTALATSVVALALFQALLGLGHIGLAVGLQTMISNRGTAADHDSRFGAFAVTQSLGQLIGPAAAGILAGNGSASPTVDVVFVVSAIAVLVAAPLALTLGPSDRPARGEEGETPPPSEGMRTAVRRVIKVPSMRQALLAGIAVVVSNNVLIAYLPAYGVATGLSVELVGLLLTLRAGASMASRLLIGVMRSRVNRRTLLAACLLAPALALFVVSLRSEVAILFLAMFVVGFGLGLGQPLTLTWIAGRSPAELRGTAVALRLAGNRVGQFLVPATLGVIGGIAGVSAVFWSLGILLVVTAVAVRTARFVETPLESD